MRVLVCGGRDFTDREAVFSEIDAINNGDSEGHGPSEITCIIHGCASGADTLASEWARLRGVPVEGYRAEWEKHGRRAGPLRNQRMLDEGEPDHVVAFPGGRGTADMVRRARKAGVYVDEVGP